MSPVSVRAASMSATGDEALVRPEQRLLLDRVHVDARAPDLLAGRLDLAGGVEDRPRARIIWRARGGRRREGEISATRSSLALTSSSNAPTSARASHAQQGGGGGDRRAPAAIGLPVRPGRPRNWARSRSATRAHRGPIRLSRRVLDDRSCREARRQFGADRVRGPGGPGRPEPGDRWPRVARHIDLLGEATDLDLRRGALLARGVGANRGVTGRGVRVGGGSGLISCGLWTLARSRSSARSVQRAAFLQLRQLVLGEAARGKTSGVGVQAARRLLAHRGTLEGRGGGVQRRASRAAASRRRRANPPSRCNSPDLAQVGLEACQFSAAFQGRSPPPSTDAARATQVGSTTRPSLVTKRRRGGAAAARSVSIQRFDEVRTPEQPVQRGVDPLGSPVQCSHAGAGAAPARDRRVGSASRRRRARAARPPPSNASG